MPAKTREEMTAGPATFVPEEPDTEDIASEAAVRVYLTETRRLLEEIAAFDEQIARDRAATWENLRATQAVLETLRAA